MPTTRPGFIWSGTEWVAIGQEAVLAPVSYQATAPTTPATGDIWIESDVDVPSIDSAQFLRWRKTMTGGETSLSGNDDSSLPLAYTPGYEQLYINGVLQVRGGDYTATTGTTVTGLTALVANDVVEIFSAVARTVADVYTQTQSDARFVNKSVGGLNLVIPTSATNGTVGANGSVTIGNAVGSVTVNGVFSAAYDNYKIILNGGASSAQTNLIYQNGPANTTTSYYGALYGANFSTGAFVSAAVNNGTGFTHAGGCDIGTVSFCADVQSPFLAKYTTFTSSPVIYGAVRGAFSGDHEQGVSYTSFSLIPNSGTITGGTIRIYGYNNGA
jgi:hypothetical protein